MGAYNNTHISKTMGIYAVGMDFEDSIENGGRSINLFFQRSQSDKVRQRNLVGKNGVIIKNKGYIHYFDCYVTGSNDGTSKDPESQLKIFFIEKFTKNEIKIPNDYQKNIKLYWPSLQDW